MGILDVPIGILDILDTHECHVLLVYDINILDGIQLSICWID